jgi:hypothetical protein
MKPVKLISITPSTRKDKKYDATFLYDDGKERKVAFGAKGYSDYTINKDMKRKENYIARHGATEKALWSQPDTPAALSRFILWNLPTINTSINDFKIRFGL